MKKILAIIGIAFLTLPKLAFAVCPVCTVAVGAGLGLAEWLGIDDTISGLWIGALIVSVSIWTINWLNKRKKSSTLRNSKRFDLEEFPDEKSGKEKVEPWKKWPRNTFVFLIYYALIILPLWWKGKIGHPLNRFCGIDKLLFGIILGSLLFAAAAILHIYLFRKNGGKSFFKGQKIALPIIFLLSASLFLYFFC